MSFYGHSLIKIFLLVGFSFGFCSLFPSSRAIYFFVRFFIIIINIINWFHFYCFFRFLSNYIINTTFNSVAFFIILIFNIACNLFFNISEIRFNSCFKFIFYNTLHYFILFLLLFPPYASLASF
jgi:hypothetical protein